MNCKGDQILSILELRLATGWEYKDDDEYVRRMFNASKAQLWPNGVIEYDYNAGSMTTVQRRVLMQVMYM
jgi:hypothetical protein